MALNLKAEWAKRPVWLNVLLVFCLYMSLIYVPWDVLWKPVGADEDVWLGYTLHGWPAKVGGVAHWIVYGSLAWGLWHMRPWVWPLAAAYVAQVAVAMLVWQLIDPRGRGIVWGLLLFVFFLVPAVALWRARPRAASSIGS